MKRFDYDLCKDCKHCWMAGDDDSEIYGCNLNDYIFVEIDNGTGERHYRQETDPERAKEPPPDCPCMLEYIMREQLVSDYVKRMCEQNENQNAIKNL